jgi:ATP-dependent Clp protease ATP-binding subunit ClpC
MWNLLTMGSRHVILHAQQEAWIRGESLVAPEHLLLGLFHEADNVASRILQKFVDPTEIPHKLLPHMKPQTEAATAEDMQLTPEAKQVLDLAYDETKSSPYTSSTLSKVRRGIALTYDETFRKDKEFIGTEHLLLGLIRLETTLAGRVLKENGIELEKVREQIQILQDRYSISG